MMNKVKLFEVQDTRYEIWEFFCPGCGHKHVYYTKNPGITEQDKSHVWQFNGDVNNPTFTPSLLNRWGTHVDPNYKPPFQDPSGQNWSNTGHLWSGICHLYVTNGQIQYLGDCTHHLAGKIVDMEEIK